MQALAYSFTHSETSIQKVKTIPKVRCTEFPLGNQHAFHPEIVGTSVRVTHLEYIQWWVEHRKTHEQGWLMFTQTEMLIHYHPFATTLIPGKTKKQLKQSRSTLLTTRGTIFSQVRKP